MFIWRNQGDLYYLEIEEFAKYGIKTCFTSRLGGVSQGPYSSLNLGLHTGDELERVLTNRRLVAEVLDLDYQKFVAAEQVHSNQVYIVNTDDVGRGANKYEEAIPGVDTLITNQSGVPLISFYADCVPLFIMEPQKRIIALAHAGWKGTALKIAWETVEKMKRIYKVNPANLWVGIGPSISRNYYEVDEQVIVHFRKGFEDYHQFISAKGKGKYLLDLQSANIFLFEKAGVPSRQIINSGYCTYQNNDYFYSYRREKGITGRMASIICS